MQLYNMLWGPAQLGWIAARIVLYRLLHTWLNRRVCKIRVAKALEVAIACSNKDELLHCIKPNVSITRYA